MKKISLLPVSLLVNGLLLVVLCIAMAEGGKPGHAMETSHEVGNRSLRVSALAQKGLRNDGVPSSMRMKEPFHWNQIESADYRVYIQNLRAVECPEATIRDMIVAELDELFAGRVRELVIPYVPQFWSLLADKKQFEAQLEVKAKEIEQLKEERKEMLRLLLAGDDGDFPADEQETNEIAAAKRSQKLYDFLSPGKCEQVVAVEEKYQRLIADVYRTQSNLNDVEMQKRARELDEARKREWSGFLTPAEVAELGLRTSRHADLRYRLTGFQASEDELKAIVGVYEKHSESVESREPNVDVRVAQRAEALRLQREELRALMGESRLAEFERAQDTDYQQLYRVGTSLSLSQDTVNALYQQQKQADELARQWQEDRNLSAEERSARFSELREQLEAGYRSTLSQTNFDAFRQLDYGRWIDRLQ